MVAQFVFRDTPALSDIDAVGKMAAATGFFRADEVDVAVELVEERIANGLESEYYFIFADDAAGKMQGYVCYGPIQCTIGSFDLYWFVVDKNCQGKGLGRLLMEKAEDAMRQIGGRRVYVETSGKAQYDPTRAFYGRCGYS